MSYFDWNELISFSVILIVIKFFLKKQVSVQEIDFSQDELVLLTVSLRV